MAARLGKVLYWIGNIIAALALLSWGVVALVVVFSERVDIGGIIVWGIGAVPIAAAAYGIGRACRYVLAGN